MRLWSKFFQVSWWAVQFALVTGLGISLVGCGPTFMPRAHGDGPRPGTEKAAAATAADFRKTFENPGGMWMPRQLKDQAELLSKLGLELAPAALTEPTANPLGAVLWLGGCTASFVSPDGLIITNHHCVTRALQYNSTPERNLLATGFLAADRGAEKPIGPGSHVYVTRAYRDVTTKMRDGLAAIADPRQRDATLETREKQIIAECERRGPGIRCRLASFFGGGQYLLIEQLALRDVRLVYAPAAGIGQYGGEIDNWRWPRHTGDFAFYRAYVGKDGKPADYGADNVPYRPAHHLKVATTPLREHDLVIVAGFPARTARLRTAREVREAVDWIYPRRLQMCIEYIDLLERLSRSDKALAVKAHAKLRGLNNWRTNIRGTLDGLVADGLARKKIELEAQLRAWIEQQPERRQRYGGVVDKLAGYYATYRSRRAQDGATKEAVWMSQLLDGAVKIVRMAEERPKSDAARDPEYQQRNWQRILQKQQRVQRNYDRRLDQAKLTLALVRAARLPDKQRPALLGLVLSGAADTEENISRAVAKMYEQTKLEDLAQRKRLFETATTAELRKSDDPFIKLALELRPLLQAIEDRTKTYQGAAVLEKARYIAALKEKLGGRLAPDANGTLRITYGTVRGYQSPERKRPYYPFSRLSGVVKKHTGKKPFKAPRPLLEAAHGPFGPYLHDGLGELPVDFLSDLDITGGNSGSPTLNARGQLVGLAFDGNYEAMASDWLFMPEITRCIHVDIRYVLWIMDRVDPAEHLLREMGITPTAD